MQKSGVGDCYRSGDVEVHVHPLAACRFALFVVVCMLFDSSSHLDLCGLSQCRASANLDVESKDLVADDVWPPNCLSSCCSHVANAKCSPGIVGIDLRLVTCFNLDVDRPFPSMSIVFCPRSNIDIVRYA